ncbi:TRAF-like signal transducer, putative [Talaromyces stipitatus ATCC 10500]|uniref:TRAF-like signal transducer, putative n=1 Tax=Talaromyces stipitatus (strain ATCC 10500 / CBS 375.48 / QM 6759 / NRRL 1006) TaxID=441959 RepID=B8MQ55_TALSN|nr:TRAF-like signal transducer, putative [Talaromyces stipitatus ATCC 10500]EED13081.1 TRAF-like signal transducer, putative [Talaromyces stipitatus ATCC 10500]
MDIAEFLTTMDLERGVEELVDLRALDYVSTYDEHLMCPICHCPFIRPLRLQCDHVFCQKCINDAIVSNSRDFRCPSCRARGDISGKVPRILINMCDDVRVRCPYSTEGCAETMARGHVQLHVDKYCDYKLMKCPDLTCGQKTRKKNLNPEKCMHNMVKCESCEESVMEQDLEEHQDQHCPSLRTTCPDCGAMVFRSALEQHIDTCPEAIHPCQASKYGCPVKLKRSELAIHERSCPLITIGPYIEVQNSRIDSLDMTIRQLRQRNEILEDGIASIRSTLMESARFSPENRTQRQSPGEDMAQDSSQSGPTEIEDSDRSSQLSTSTAMTYLLSLHESLREEVSQLSHAMTDLDARASMAILNESMRVNEDLAHTSAAINTIRMQIHWLLNPRLQHGHRLGAATGAGGESSPGPSTRPGPGHGGLTPRRRLSDSGREGTKL